MRSNTLPPKPSAPVPYNGEIPEDPLKTPEPKKPEAPTPSKEIGTVVEVTPARLQSPEKPAEKVITKHIDITTGKEISKQEDGKQPKKDIPGYEFVETKDEGGNTVHYYKPVEKPSEKVITKHIDITTGKEISKQEDGKQPKKDIPGYEFVETKDEGGNTIHYYKPVEKKETPKELPKTSEQSKQRTTAVLGLLSVVGLGGLVTYFGLRKRDEN